MAGPLSGGPATVVRDQDGIGVAPGADRFITDNRRDFASTIEEIEISFPRVPPG